MTRLTLLGTGTSQGVPMIACDCWVCTSPDSRDKRLRTSAMVEQDGVRVIIDAGPDFRQQMLRENVKTIDGILLSHEHKDHIGGLDDVRAFNYSMGVGIDIYSTTGAQRTVMKDFDYAFSNNNYPGVPVMNMVSIDPDKAFKIKTMEIIPILGRHYKLPVLGFRIGGIAYLTDFNYICDEELEKLKGVETLVINALRRELHISHFTLDQALEVSRIVQPKNTYFTHLSHQMGRYEHIQKELPENAYFSYDGLVVETEI